MPLAEIMSKIKLVFDREGMDGIRSFSMVGVYGTTKMTLKWSGRATPNDISSAPRGE